uniref:Uncharacterized protein C167.05-like n=1 Tax=Rhizophora mucronata TaxID=61149 RepID=A0A2P2JBP2_RHIMU
MAHFRASLLPFEKSMATPIFLSFVIFNFLNPIPRQIKMGEKDDQNWKINKKARTLCKYYGRQANPSMPLMKVNSLCNFLRRIGLQLPIALGSRQTNNN